MEHPESAAVPSAMPRLPDLVEQEALRTLSDPELTTLLDELAEAERATRAAMAPYDRHLGEVRARVGQIGTERRRRERSAKHATRKTVREHAGSDRMPTLIDALAMGPSAAPDDVPLTSIRAFLKSGGEVTFGYPSRPGNLTLTDGRQQRTASTLGEARALFADGWDLGTTAVPGVRVHMTGTRLERVVGGGDVVIGSPGAAGVT